VTTLADLRDGSKRRQLRVAMARPINSANSFSPRTPLLYLATALQPYV